MPDDLMVLLKHGLGGHIRDHAYQYRNRLDHEVTSIRRICELKDRAFAVLWALFAATCVSVGNYVSSLLLMRLESGED